MKSLVRWDPFRMLRSIEPLDELRTMQREMGRLIDQFLGTGMTGEEGFGRWVPSVESFIKDGTLFIRAEVPGIEPKNLDVSITDRELVIKGERRSERDEKEKEYAYQEISYGSFERRFLLPDGAKADELKASFENGILEITVPVPDQPKAKRIEIKTGETKKVEAGPAVKKAA